MPFRRLLVPIDLGPASAHALELALAIAAKDDADVTLLHAFWIPPIAYANGVAVPCERIAEGAREEVDALVAATKKRWPRVERAWVDGEPRRAIADVARERRPDLIVMGTHGRRGIPRALVGSVAANVVRTSPVPVLTTPARLEKATIRRVLAATDFGEPARHAAHLGAELAASFDAGLTLLHAYEVPALLSDAASREAIARQARLALDATVADVQKVLPSADGELGNGDPREVILEAARARNADLIVMGTRARRGLSRLLLGSVAEAIVRTSPVPVLTTAERDAALG